MKQLFFACASAAAAAAFAGPMDNAWIRGTTDRDPLSYKPGEEMTFTPDYEGRDFERSTE